MAFEDDGRSTGPHGEGGSLERTYLTFEIVGTEYAVPVALVTEIVQLPKSFPIPDVPAYVRGVINLRGRVVPLLDVRCRFGLKHEPYTERTVVVVLDLGTSATGLVVDAVSEVIDIDPAQVEPLTASLAGGEASMVRGIGKRENGVCLIVDVPALVAARAPANDTHPPLAAGAERG
jgi:purine-binding chemotaxis protein CheW